MTVLLKVLIWAVVCSPICLGPALGRLSCMFVLRSLIVLFHLLMFVCLIHLMFLSLPWFMIFLVWDFWVVSIFDFPLRFVCVAYPSLFTVHSVNLFSPLVTMCIYFPLFGFFPLTEYALAVSFVVVAHICLLCEPCPTTCADDAVFFE
jgi:hypothetical protein